MLAICGSMNFSPVAIGILIAIHYWYVTVPVVLLMGWGLFKMLFRSDGPSASYSKAPSGEEYFI